MTNNQHRSQSSIPRLYFLMIMTLALLPTRVITAQSDTSYSFLVAGHAYGSHTGGNTGLHPALLESLDNGFSPDARFIVFTGDIVNISTEENWQQVADEMAAYPLETYYVMGNHDDNDAGHAVFEAKHGGTHYSFHNQSSLFIVLNSTEVSRSISPDQLIFLEDLLNTTADTILKVFIFFHEIIWNSIEKYIDVRSNSRSRYDQMVDYSNYWEEVHPMLQEYPGIQFYLIAGDVGGNPDAIAAFYDRWDNVRLIASGMGEVLDENYLLMHVVGKDSVDYELVPLQPDTLLDPLPYYTVPPAVDTISGPASVNQWDENIYYTASPVFNTKSYEWLLPEGISGNSTRQEIEVAISGSFLEGELAVRAFKDGFGRGPSASKTITGNPSSLDYYTSGELISKLSLVDHQLLLEGFSEEGGRYYLRLYTLAGQLTGTYPIWVEPGVFSITQQLARSIPGIYMLSVEHEGMQEVFLLIQQ